MITWRFSVVLLFSVGMLLTHYCVDGNLGRVLTQSGGKKVILKLERGVPCILCFYCEQSVII